MRYTAEQEYVGKEQKKYQYTRQDDGGPVKIPLQKPEPFVRILTKQQLLERAAGRR